MHLLKLKEKIMIKRYSLHDKEMIIESDLGAEFPVYLYVSEKRDYLLSSTSVTELLNDSRVIKPLEVSREGVSFLLQSAVVPLPKTVYKNLFIVGIGERAVVKTLKEKVEIDFSYSFPFLNKNREDEAEVDEAYILEILAEATISRVDEKRDTFLFQSAGKDSNMIALALAEGGYQDKITSVSLKGYGEKDESEIAEKLAKQLGFKHQKLYEPTEIGVEEQDALHHYFKNIPLPCMDTAALAYPFYTTQMEFSKSNLIDGMGNDVFIGHIPDNREYTKQRLLSTLHHLRPVTGRLSSGSRAEIATATRVEWVGLFGLTYGDSRLILDDAVDAYDYWHKVNQESRDWDYLDLRASIRGTIIDQEVFTRKVRNFANSVDANLILPWMNQKVVAYFQRLPEGVLFDRKGLKNKLLLRKMLKERMNLDSDKLGKLAYGFDFYSILMMMKREVDHEIRSCALWNKEGIDTVLNTFYKKIASRHPSSERLKILIERLYLISAWHNNNRYL
jgi:asparagine synthase (glutamine-hydrolysing)